MNVAQRFGANLVRERRRAGLSQDELSFRADLHRTEISQAERGLRLVRIDTLAKLAGALEIEAARLLDGIAWRPGPAVYGRWESTEEADTL